MIKDNCRQMPRMNVNPFIDHYYYLCYNNIIVLCNQHTYINRDLNNLEFKKFQRK